MRQQAMYLATQRQPQATKIAFGLANPVSREILMWMVQSIALQPMMGWRESPGSTRRAGVRAWAVRGMLTIGVLSGLLLSTAASAQSTAQTTPNVPVANERSAAQTPADLVPVLDRVEARFGSRPDAAARTPYGLVEIRFGTDLFYVDEQVSFLLDGVLIDAQTRTNVTAARVEQLTAVAFDELPLHLAIKQVNGNGERRLAVFEDPNCGFCKQLRRTLADLPDVTLYTFVYPILSPDSMQKSRVLLCAADPGQAWDDWMLSGRMPSNADDCDTSAIDQTLLLGRALNVRGTPLTIFADGSRVSGAVPEPQFLERLQRASP